MRSQDPVTIGAELERLLAKVNDSDDGAATEARELATALMSFYEAGLSRVLEILRAHPGGDALVRRVTSDPLIGTLLSVHDLAPRADTPLIQIVRPSELQSTSHEPAREPHCELCRSPLTGEHAHLVDVESRRLLCACAMCRTVGGRYRLVPSRYVHSPSMRITPAQWESLGLPVGLVFFVVNSLLARTVACYPGPAGATESLLPLDAWPALSAQHPWIRDIAPDVEALLIRRIGEEYLAFIVPVDACYELVGRIRRTWAGLGGGPAAAAEIDRFFQAIVERSTTAAEVSA
jgi:hypothetical protein